MEEKRKLVEMISRVWIGGPTVSELAQPAAPESIVTHKSDLNWEVVK